MKKFKKQKGITLIALVVTIVILIILATISINAVFGENGLIKMAEKTKILNATKEKEEEVQFVIADLLLENNMDASKVTVSAVVERVKQNYKDQKSQNSISGESSLEDSDNFPGYIQYDPPSSTVDQTIIVNVDENLNVSASSQEPSAEIKPQKSEYTKTGNVYYNTPDLSGFNPANTYYIVYDKDGNNPKVYGRIDKVKAPGTVAEEEVPEEFKDMIWHDYGNKVWANVVTVNGEEVACWTWIPRYVYSIPENQTKGQEKADIKFVYEKNGTNNYIDGETGQVDNTKIKDYKLPESFKFDEKQLKGYWISKTEVQNRDNGIEKLVVEGTNKGINVTTTNLDGQYTIYLDGVIYQEHIELPYEVTNLKANKNYTITVYSEKNSIFIGSANHFYHGKTNKIEIDISKFDKEHTYYVTYDENGNNEQIAGRIDKIKEPTNWYNYEKNIWANLVTVKDDQVIYWTYIPRYEYRVQTSNQRADIRYIPVNQTEADAGYVIPESFKFGDKDIPGYWMSKYQVQDVGNTVEKLGILLEDNAFKVVSSNSKANEKYTIYKDGEIYQKNIELPYDITDLKENESHEYTLYSETDKKMIGSQKVTLQKLETKIQIDLSGFNPDCTYYVTYGDDGTGETTIGDNIQVNEEGEPTNAPTNWYNYDQKIWANIVTKGTDADGNELIAFWTYIPRYEYLTYGNKYGDESGKDKIDIKFISKTKTEPDYRYKIPESFTFDGKQLAGYWISKYEVQGTID